MSERYYWAYLWEDLEKALADQDKRIAGLDAEIEKLRTNRARRIKERGDIATEIAWREKQYDQRNESHE